MKSGTGSVARPFPVVGSDGSLGTFLHGAQHRLGGGQHSLEYRLIVPVGLIRLFNLTFKLFPQRQQTRIPSHGLVKRHEIEPITRKSETGTQLSGDFLPELVARLNFLQDPSDLDGQMLHQFRLALLQGNPFLLKQPGKIPIQFHQGHHHRQKLVQLGPVGGMRVGLGSNHGVSYMTFLRSNST